MNWKELIREEETKDYYQKLQAFLKAEYQNNKTIYPPQNETFTAFDLTPFEKVKVVILGQDPYHGPHQAHGLAFSVKKGVKFPPSLRNILRELHDDLKVPLPNDGDLSAWAKQGVLLLNTVLTVEAGKAGSHHKKGWETFTDTVISHLNEHHTGLVFVLWGAPAQTKKKLIDENKHFIVESVHPSPLSAYRGFFGSRPFSTINHLLQKSGKSEINWNLS
ncbi:MAG TPA: uracil-DNA glycosylase [Bacteriovoracaceae bacterium]|nr:uracil-DNA glycosylase [Bacteriovoracaceae bacterium]